MQAIPLDPDDVAPGRALRTFFAQFWSAETGEPRDVYDRFVAATPTADGVTVIPSGGEPGPGIWVRPDHPDSHGALLFLHGGGYGLAPESLQELAVLLRKNDAVTID